MSKPIIVVPIYKAELPVLERYSLEQSMAALKGRDVWFIGPRGLNRAYYADTYPAVPFLGFDDECFTSISSYSRLLLNIDFYRQFADYEFMLILQTDAIVLRDELDFWCAQPFDYVGAPWMPGFGLFVNAGRFEGEFGRKVVVHVGNGGLSLRRVRKCISLLKEFDVALSVFDRTGSSEDLFFSVMGALSGDFIIPNEITASQFSMEMNPSYYFHVNGGRVPMGGHAWWLYEPEFWKERLRGPVPL